MKEKIDEFNLMLLAEQIDLALSELLSVAQLQKGQVVVLGCSTSEVLGDRIGTHSSEDVAAILVDTILLRLRKEKIYFAAQCCEHLNRALIVERECARKNGWPEVTVRPMPKAGGAMASRAWTRAEDPVAVEHIKADAGIDIGDTLIGMHLHSVAVPVRPSCRKIGAANLVMARTRPKYIGGPRAFYDADQR